jgi:hypothetical protein
VLTTTLVGRWPGVLVAIMGLVNSSLMKTPGSIWIVNSAEQVALISSAVVSVLVILVGDYYRSLSRRELSDLHELHELSATLASIPKLPEQLHLILSTFARIHDSAKGIIFLRCEPPSCSTPRSTWASVRARWRRCGGSRWVPVPACGRASTRRAP